MRPRSSTGASGPERRRSAGRTASSGESSCSQHRATRMLRDGAALTCGRRRWRSSARSALRACASSRELVGRRARAFATGEPEAQPAGRLGVAAAPEPGPCGAAPRPTRRPRLERRSVAAVETWLIGPTRSSTQRRQMTTAAAHGRRPACSRARRRGSVGQRHAAEARRRSVGRRRSDRDRGPASSSGEPQGVRGRDRRGRRTRRCCALRASPDGASGALSRRCR